MSDQYRSSERYRDDPSGVSPAHLPYGIVVAAAWSWRLVVIIGAIFLGTQALATVSAVVIPFAVALLLAVLLMPMVRFLVTRVRLPRALSALFAVLFLIVFVSGITGLAGQQLTTGTTDLGASLQQGVNQVTDWLKTGPFQLTGAQLESYLQQAQDSLSQNSDALTSGVLTAGSTAAHFLVGLVICLIATFFYLAQGEKMWRFLVRMLPRAAQEPTYQASRRGWVSLGGYARTQVLVAGIDAIGIGLGAFFLGLPFVIPMTLIVFIASFVPIVGAFVSGAVVILVALVFKGWVAALIMLGIVLLVQQVESHVLQPFLMGKAVSLHPLVVIAAVAIGSFLLGIVGALFAVPFVAVANTVVRYLVGNDQFPELGTDPMPTSEDDAATSGQVPEEDHAAATGAAPVGATSGAAAASRSGADAEDTTGNPHEGPGTGGKSPV